MATATKWKNKIKQACVDAGTYEPFFDSTIETLAKKLEDRDRARKQYEDEGSNPVMEYTNKNGQTNTVKNPLYQSMEKLRMDILTYLRELGITPSGLKKLKQDSFGDNTKVSKVEEMLISLSQM